VFVLLNNFVIKINSLHFHIAKFKCSKVNNKPCDKFNFIKRTENEDNIGLHFSTTKKSSKSRLCYLKCKRSTEKTTNESIYVQIFKCA